MGVGSQKEIRKEKGMLYTNRSFRLAQARIRLYVWLGRNFQHPQHGRVLAFMPTLTNRINTARFWQSWAEEVI